MSARSPVLTAGLLAATVTLFAVAGAPDGLALAADAPLAQPWRWLTAHFVHLSPTHLLWDGLAFAFLAGALEVRSRELLVGVLGTAMLGVSAFVAATLPTDAAYAGLSGVDAALAAAVATELVRSGGPERRVGILLAVAFAAKLVGEQAAGGMLFAGPGAHVASVHLVGAALGTLAALATRAPTPTTAPAPG